MVKKVLSSSTMLASTPKSTSIATPTANAQATQPIDIPSYLVTLTEELAQIEHGFKIQQTRSQADFKLYRDTGYNNKNQIINHYRQLAFAAYESNFYQVRMYGVFMLGHVLCTSAIVKDKDSQVLEQNILTFLRDQVAQDDNWRVQEVLAKVFDQYCASIGYEQALPTIDLWLNCTHPNTRRAVTEGLRIWTSRPYFKQHPQDAISRLSKLRADPSEYVRKSVGNALRDISRKFPELIRVEIAGWELTTKSVQQVYKLASKFIS